MKTIDFSCKNKVYSIPNSWDQITPTLYLQLIKDILRMSRGELSPAMLRVNFVCNAME